MTGRNGVLPVMEGGDTRAMAEETSPDRVTTASSTSTRMSSLRVNGSSRSRSTSRARISWSDGCPVQDAASQEYSSNPDDSFPMPPHLPTRLGAVVPSGGSTKPNQAAFPVEAGTRHR